MVTAREFELILEKISKATGYDKEICKERLIDNDFDIEYIIEELGVEHEIEDEEDE